MQKAILTIPEPCQEQWQKMTPTEQGRFCQACAKEVIDFSRMTDTEILDYLSRHQQQKICGRVAVAQLEREIVRPGSVKKRVYWYWNYLMASLLLFTRQAAAQPVQLNKVSPPIVNPRAENQKPPQETDTAVNPSPLRVSGKVVDINNLPIPYATVYVKGTHSGVSANEQGSFSILTNANAVLVFSTVGYKQIEIPVAGQRYIIAHFQKDELVMLGGISVGVVVNASPDYYDGKTIGTVPIRNHVAVFSVKDSTTGKPVPRARFIIQKNNEPPLPSDESDARGRFKIKRVKKDDNYAIRVNMPGYETNEFSLTGDEFEERKGGWDVFLKKIPVQPIQPQPDTKLPVIRMGAVSAVADKNKPIYVVDGTIVPDAGTIRAEDIDSVEVLQGPAASALFGKAGSNGAILITTKKSISRKIKTLDTVKVTDYGWIKCRSLITTCTTFVKNVFKPSPADSLHKNPSLVKLAIYPNPVQRGGVITLKISGNVPETGLLRVFNSIGQLLMEKQLNKQTKNQPIRFICDKAWSSGICYCNLLSEQGTIIQTGSFIVQ